jgi:hypothetical protein
MVWITGDIAKVFKYYWLNIDFRRGNIDVQKQIQSMTLYFMDL